MRRYLSIILVTLAFQTMADVNSIVNVHAKIDFEAPLAAFGRWVDSEQYGRCWQPVRVPAGWRPYSDGRWLWTDCGWYWSSSEPWAWACYHYGYWVGDASAGWLWLPDLEWSPAWVTWRIGGGFIGWAPSAPDGVVVTPAWYGFVGENHFGEPVMPSQIILTSAAFFAQTTEISGTKHQMREVGAGHSQKVAINEGPNPAELEKTTGKKFAVTPVAEAVRLTPPPLAVAPVVPGQSLTLPPGVPQIPGTPSTPQTPVTPTQPLNPDTPLIPITPMQPQIPAQPTTPTTPGTPGRPNAPGQPTFPGGGF